MYAYVWEFKVALLRIEEFEQAYRPNGRWAKLFSRSQGYLRTELLRDTDMANRYLTIDYWTDRQSLEQFKKVFSTEFEKLDSECEAYTESERHVGDFDVQ